MLKKSYARFVAVMIGLVSALALSAVVSPPASANFPSPDDGLTYHWTAVSHWSPPNSTLNCDYRNGWAVVDSDTLRLRYELSCDGRAVSLGGEFYIQRDSTSVVDQNNTKQCYDTSFCAKAFNISNPASTQTFYSTARWSWLKWTTASPWLRQTFTH